MLRTPWLIVVVVCGTACLWLAAKGLIVASDDKIEIASPQQPATVEGSSQSPPCGSVVLRVGQIEPGVKVEREFEVAGCSDIERRVGRITTSCGCLDCQVDKNIFAVGQSLRGKIAIQAKNAAGRFGTTARIEFLGPVPSFATIKVEGTVVPIVVSTPSQITVEGRDLSHGREIALLIEDTSGTGLEIEPVKPLPPWMASISVARTTGREATSGEARLSNAWNVAMVVRYDRGTPSYGELKFEVRGPRERSVVVPFTIRPTVTLHHLNPTQFVFRICPDVAPIPAKVTLRLPKTLRLRELPRLDAKELEGYISTTIKELEENVFAIEATPQHECSNVRGAISVEWMDGDYRASAQIPVIIEMERRAEVNSENSD